jgi:cullin 1
MASQPMPPANTDIATAWAFLEEGVDHIMTKRDTDLSYERFWALYTVQYNYCTSSSPSTGSNLIGYNLYNSLICYFEQYLQHLRDVRRFVHDDRITMNTSCSIRIHYKTSSS